MPLFWIVQVFVNVAPGLSIVPSGMVSLMKVAFAIQNLVTPVDAAEEVTKGVRVGSAAAGVLAEGMFVAGALELDVFARGMAVARAANDVSVTDAGCIF